MAHRVPIKISLDSFEGPLDLLIYLIQNNELDISSISISRITNQYLEYVMMMRNLNFDIASDFLVMAATLIYWKSKTILPNDDENKDESEDDELGFNQEDLVRQLLEHQRFLAAGDKIGMLPRLNEDFFVRPSMKPPVVKVWREMNVTDLGLSYQDILVRKKRSKKILQKETVSVSEKMKHFVDNLEIGRLTELQTLFEDNSRAEQVVTFLASLELSRLKKLKTFQQETYDPIFVELLEKIEKFGLQISSDFDKHTRPDADTGVTA
jgi:segregation and condensation protein A